MTLFIATDPRYHACSRLLCSNLKVHDIPGARRCPPAFSGAFFLFTPGNSDDFCWSWGSRPRVDESAAQLVAISFLPAWMRMRSIPLLMVPLRTRLLHAPSYHAGKSRWNCSPSEATRKTNYRDPGARFLQKGDQVRISTPSAQG